MRHYTRGIRSTNGTTTEAALEIIAGADVGFRLVGTLSLALAAATASSFGLGRPAAKGVTPTTPTTIPANDGGSINSKATTALAWGTSPTVPASFFYRGSFPNVIGSRSEWALPASGIWVPAGQTIVLWNIGATGVTDITFTIQE
jgi:hypothetical protein